MLTHNAGCVTDALNELSLKTSRGTSRDIPQVIGNTDDMLMVFNKLRGSNKVKRVNIQKSGDGVWTAQSVNNPNIDITLRMTSKSGPPTLDVNGLEQGIRKLKFR